MCCIPDTTRANGSTCLADKCVRSGAGQPSSDRCCEPWNSGMLEVVQQVMGRFGWPRLLRRTAVVICAADSFERSCSLTITRSHSSSRSSVQMTSWTPSSLKRQEQVHHREGKQNVAVREDTAHQYERSASSTADTIRRRPSLRRSRFAWKARTSDSSTRLCRLRGRRSEGNSPSSSRRTTNGRESPSSSAASAGVRLTSEGARSPRGRRPSRWPTRGAPRRGPGATAPPYRRGAEG